MEFSAAIIDNGRTFEHFHFSKSGEVEKSRKEIDQLKNSELDVLFYKNESLNNNEELIENLSTLKKSIPMKSIESKDGQTLVDHFSSPEVLDQAYHSTRNVWSLGNTLSLLEEIFDLQKHLTNLWPNNRTEFFEELWFILKRVMAPTELTIIYNDIQKDMAKENQKNKLIKCKITGRTTASPMPAEQIDIEIMESYLKDFSLPFSVIEFDQTKGRLVATALIHGSPALIMAKQDQLNPIAQSTLKGLFRSFEA